ncbi:MAG: zf-HC2 domain-containing protein [Leptospiraceae bacterium]|nr:zf-HC2 domain-containing protein [Leptospiraceae bacterium]
MGRDSLMDCQEFVNLMSGFVDGDLVADQAADWQTHLDHCPDCSQFFQSFQSSRDIIRFLKSKPCPLEISRRLHDLVVRQLSRCKNRSADGTPKSD